MSLKYRNSQGVETPVAGLNGTSGELVPSVALMQSGTVNFSCDANSWTTVDVTFTTPMPDTDYLVNTDSGEAAYVHVQVATTKRTTGFTMIVWNRDAVSNTGIIRWTAFKLMTDTVHEADSAHIVQNTANFAPAFNETTSYVVGDYVTYNNVLYRCTTAHTAGVWAAGHFTRATVGGILGEIVPDDATASNKLLSYKSTQLYANYQNYNTRVLRIEYPAESVTRLHLIAEPGLALRDVFIQVLPRNPYVVVYDMGQVSTFTVKTATVSNKRVVYINVKSSDASVVVNQDDIPTTGYGVLQLPTVTVIDTENEEWTSATEIVPFKLRPTSSVTRGSTAPVTSGGVYEYLDRPTIEISEVFDDTTNILNVSSLAANYGLGTYTVYAQGNTGHGTVTIHIWRAVSQAIIYDYIMIEGSEVTAGSGIIYSTPTIALNSDNLGTVDAIVKVAPSN